jgi:hypothetical protein
MQYAWEGEQLKSLGLQEETQVLSVSTRALVQGIETGSADMNEDGRVTDDELCEYVTDRVSTERPGQTPKTRPLEKEGKIIVASNPGALEGTATKRYLKKCCK